MTTDRVFVLLMMVLLMMAGCFEATSTTEAKKNKIPLVEMMIQIMFQMMELI